MAYNKGDRILDKVTIATGPNTYLWFDYKEVSRNGTNYNIVVHIDLMRHI